MSFPTSSGSTETTTEVAFLDSVVSQSLLRYLAKRILGSFAFSMDRLRKGNSWWSSSWRTSDEIE